MGFLQAGTPGAFGSVTSFNLTVPAGVTPDQVVLIAVAGVVNVNGADVTAASTGATFTTIAGGAAVFDNTLWGGLIKGTGLTAGNTITVTLSAARQVAAAHYYFDNDFNAPSAFNARTDSATNVAPSIAVTPGSDVYVVSLERSTTVGTTISGAVNSNGNTVAALSFTETATPSFATLALRQFSEPDDPTSGTTTLTYTNTSTSGLALTIEGISEIPPSGEFAGGHAWAGTFAGETDKSGAFAGGHSWAGLFAGGAEAAGGFIGGHSWAGGFVGSEPTGGEFAGGHSWTGSFAGQTDRSGTFDGQHSWAALFAGGQEAAGGFIGGHHWAGVFAGEEPAGGVFAGGHGWAGGFAGVAPPLEPAVGSFSGGHSWNGNFEAVAVVIPDLPDFCWPVDTSCVTDWDAWEIEPDPEAAPPVVGVPKYSPADKARAIALAGQSMRMLTGYRVGGCPITVRPCRTGCEPRTWRTYPMAPYSGSTPWQPVNLGGQWLNVGCGCGSGGGCACTKVCEVRLDGPVGAIDAVKVDGLTLDPSAYRLDPGGRLVRTDGDCWPLCQDMHAPDTEEGTWSVTYTAGALVDGLGAWAAGILAGEFVQLCSTGDCSRLPTNAKQIVRDGVTLTLGVGAFPDGQTGIREVDAYVQRWNPNRLRAAPVVWSPDQKRPRRT